MSIFWLILIPSLVYFVILSISSLSAMFSERAGIVNVGIEGMIIIGATFYGIFGQIFKVSSPWMQIPLFLIAALAGGLFSMLHGFVTIKLKGDHTISGIALNLLAPAIAIFVLKRFGNANKIQSSVQELALSQNSINDWQNIISLKLLIVILVFVTAIILMNKTKWGLRFKAIGENPQAADAAGINVNFFKWQGVIISGILAGLAGGVLFQQKGVSFSGSADGMGFVALTILIMGRWKSSLILVFALFFSLILGLASVIGTGAGIFETVKEYGKLINTIPYILTFVVLIFSSKRVQGPAAAGQPYDKSKR
ncbi:ABC transporter permease [Mesomycoplasma lagogenitalium]|uniref:ABC transporter permease n=1 Tax=Mesomycoplasma lagogenitalium TaxID=171286 RepID=A0ABY8LUG7_9BACT|nr:ABC transporter permease [Mesomycoplasma lagogenitalium]WGI36877.1 ABC transporter permease [Mesomycoplasma lagogenitalium]